MAVPNGMPPEGMGVQQQPWRTTRTPTHVLPFPPPHTTRLRLQSLRLPPFHRSCQPLPLPLASARDAPLSPLPFDDSPPPRKHRHGSGIDPRPSDNSEQRSYLKVYEEELASYRRWKLPMVMLPNMYRFRSDSQEDMPMQQRNEYDRLMKVGADLLREGEQSLDGGLEVGIADRMLAEAAALFSSAASVVPSSSAPVSALGNTFLVRGKLKFLLTEKLREMFLEARSQPQHKDLNPPAKASSLQHSILKICKECEELLVDAGRKYHIVLSQNGTDDHAMFCWGLALFFRARLVAAEEQEVEVQDAKKIYLAAITKFQAAAALKKSYVPCALLYWGLALRDQAWLYPRGSDAQLNLLKQAVKVLEDAIEADKSLIQSKLALATCSEELGQLYRNKS